MTVPEIFVIRHGETEWNRQTRWQGDLDSPLTPEGRQQAVDMGQLLRRHGITPRTHRFYCSPLGRARMTARLILGGAGLTDVGLTDVGVTDVGVTEAGLTEDARLREISVGKWTGLTRDEIRARADLPEDAHFLDYYASAPGGEPIAQVFDRVAAFLSALTGPSVVVTHGVTSRALRTVAMGWGPDRLDALPGGQGVIHHVRDRQHAELVP